MDSQSTGKMDMRASVLLYMWMMCVFTSQCGSGGGDDHGGHHTDGRHTVPQHKHADAEREERQAAFEHDVHGKAEPTQ